MVWRRHRHLASYQNALVFICNGIQGIKLSVTKLSTS